MKAIVIGRVIRLNDDIARLVAEAESEGRPFMRRLWDDWQTGANRFDGAGEFLLSAHVGGRLVAMGGLNRDPYCAAKGVGRLRHLYVSPHARRIGVGRALVERVTDDAAQRFAVLRLRTTTTEAAAFYESLGFRRTGDDNATHVIDLPASLAQCRAAR